MTAPQQPVSPSLQDLGTYLQGLAHIQLERDRLRLEHAAKEAQANRQLQTEEAARQVQAKQAAEQTERDAALEQLRLLRLRHAHLLDEVPAVRTEFDALLANPVGHDTRRVLPEVQAEMSALPKYLEQLKKVAQTGMGAQQLEPLLPKGLFQIAVAHQEASQWLAKMPKHGLARYVKIGTNGERLPAFAAHWVAVLDTASKLIWELKTEGGAHSEARTFTNYGDAREGDSSAYVQEVNREKFAGHTDWRMPTIDELTQLFGATSELEHGWGVSKGGFFWSSSASSDGYAWFISFHGGSRNYNSRSSQNAVRLVRVGQ